MLSLMLDPSRFKILRLVSSLISCEQGKAIVEEYDKRFVFPMLFKCHYHLHPFAKSKRVSLIKGMHMITIWICLR